MMRTCAVCGEQISELARDDALYCSGACRLAALRARRKGAEKPQEPLQVGGCIVVTDNPNVDPLSAPLRPLLWPSEEVQFSIPADLTIPKWLRRDLDAPHWKLLDEPRD